MATIDELVKNIVTVEDLNRLLADTNEAVSLSYNTEAEDFSGALKGKVSTPFQEELEKFEKEKLIPRSPDKRASFFEGLKTQLQALPKVEIELAFPPSEEFTKKVAKTVREIANSPIVLDISVKPSILAGVTLAFRGHFKDFSFAAKLAEVLKQKYSKGLSENI